MLSKVSINPVFALLVHFIFASAAIASTPFEKAISLDVNTAKPSHDAPWLSHNPTIVKVSATAISPNEAITSRHGVRHAREIIANWRGETIRLRVAYEDPRLDLALLMTLNGDSFPEESIAVVGNRLPSINDRITLAAWDTATRSAAALSGHVKAVMFGPIKMGGNALLVHADVSFDSGTCGGGLFDANTQLVGIVVAGDARKTFSIGTPHIQAFIDEARVGKQTFDYTLPATTQPLSLGLMRQHLGITDSSVDGVVVTAIENSICNLELNDVITSVDGHAIDERGHVLIQSGVWVDYRYIIERSEQPSIGLEVLREGTVRPIEATLHPMPDKLIPVSSGDGPSYVFVYPLLVETATIELVDSVLANHQWTSLLLSRSSELFGKLGDKATDDRDSLLTVCSSPRQNAKFEGQFTGYEVIAEVNGSHVRNLAHLVQIITASSNDIVTLKFSDSGVPLMTLSKSDMIRQLRLIVSENGMSHVCSRDLEAAVSNLLKK